MQVKNEVQPIQEAEAARIKSEVAVFARRVADYQKGFRTRSFYKYSTGAEKAYPEIDQAAKDYEDMAAELHKHTQLSNMFDCPETVATASEGVAAIKADLVMVKDVWDASSLVEQQFQVCYMQQSISMHKLLYHTCTASRQDVLGCHQQTKEVMSFE